MTLDLLTLLLLAKDCKFVLTTIGHECASDINNIVHTNLDVKELFHMPEEEAKKLWNWNVVKIDVVQCKYNPCAYEAALNITISPPTNVTTFGSYRRLIRDILIDESFTERLPIKPIRIYYNQELVFERCANGAIEGDTMLEKYDSCYYEEVDGDIYLIDMKEHVEQEVDRLLIMARQR